MIERADDGVVERRAAAGIDAFQGFLKFGNGAGEVLVEIEVEVVIEVDDKGFVGRIGVLDEGERGFIHAGAFVAHAAAVVDDQAHADGNVFAFEDGKLLFDLVFVDAETVLGEAVHEFAAIVDDGGVENDEVDVHFDFAAGLTLTGVFLAGRRRGRLGLDGDLRGGARAHQEKQDEKSYEETRSVLSAQGRNSRSWNRR